MMHMIFTEEEKEWINMRTFGWTLKQGCPEQIRKQIERKKKIILKSDTNLHILRRT